MKLAQTEKSIMKWSWGRIEYGADGTINKSLETFSAMKFLIEVRKLHVWSFVHNFKCVYEVKFMEISD